MSFLALTLGRPQGMPVRRFNVELRHRVSGLRLDYESSGVSAAEALSRALQGTGLLPRFYYVWEAEVTEVR